MLSQARTSSTAAQSRSCRSNHRERDANGADCERTVSGRAAAHSRRRSRARRAAQHQRQSQQSKRADVQQRGRHRSGDRRGCDRAADRRGECGPGTRRSVRARVRSVGGCGDDGRDTTGRGRLAHHGERPRASAPAARGRVPRHRIVDAALHVRRPSGQGQGQLPGVGPVPNTARRACSDFPHSRAIRRFRASNRTAASTGRSARQIVSPDRSWYRRARRRTPA